MKKLFALIIAIFLIFAFCSCAKKEKGAEKGTYEEKPTEQTETSEIATKTEEETLSATEETATPPSIPEVPATSSSAPVTTKPAADQPAAGNTNSQNPTNNTPQEEPVVTINFVPNRFQKFGSTETYIPYSNEIFYKGTKYASVLGKNNGVECTGVVTVGSNGEYLGCIALLDDANDERGEFNIWNGRIYYLKYPAIGKVSTLHTSLSVCSMNLEGKDKKVEKNVDIPFSDIRGFTGYKDSKYLFFFAINATAQTSLCRFDMETKELVTLNQNYSSDKSYFSIENRVLVFDYPNAFYEYDTSFANERVFFQTGNTYSWSSLTANGIILIHNQTKAQYLLDFSGNLSNL